MMPYDAAVKKAWDELKKLSDKDIFRIKFLDDTYEVSLNRRIAASLSSDASTKDFFTVLLLHYLAGILGKGFHPSGEWVSFKEAEGGEFYYPAFREGAIMPILKKYGACPEELKTVLKRFRGTALKEGDVAIELKTFDDIAVRIILWKGDDEFAPEATILFDKNLTGIFSTEDIAVLLRLVAHKL